MANEKARVKLSDLERIAWWMQAFGALTLGAGVVAGIVSDRTDVLLTALGAAWGLLVPSWLIQGLGKCARHLERIAERKD